MTQESAVAPAERGPVPWSESDGTHRGLPRRVRQANLAPQLRDRSAAAESAARPASEPAVRSPEETRGMMSSLQDGWQRGRVDDLDGADDDLGGWPGGTPDALDGIDGEASR